MRILPFSPPAAPLIFAASLLIVATCPLEVLHAHVSTDASLTGRYHFRQTLLRMPDSGPQTTLSGSGTLEFDGSGSFTFVGQQLTARNPPSALSGSGTYSVDPGGFVTLTNPLDTSISMNARLGDGALVGASTEAGDGLFDLLIAIPAAASGLSNASLSGAYQVSSLEFPDGGTTNIRNTNFTLTANGAGAFAEFAVTGQAANLGHQRFQQPVSPMTYSVAPDGSGTLSFPLAAGLSPRDQLLAGAKSIFVADDGSYFIGGSLEAGQHGFVVGVRSSNGGAGDSDWTGRFFLAGLRFDADRGRLAASTGSLNATQVEETPSAIFARRTRQSDGLFDASTLVTYVPGPNGSGPFASTPGSINIAGTGAVFSTSGVSLTSSPVYELSFGTRMPAQSGSGVFLNPQGVLHAASFAPAGFPISPGSFISLFGSGFATGTTTAPSLPFPVELSGVSVAINGTPAPIYLVSPLQLSVIVPFRTSGGTATIVVTAGGVDSNAVTVPLAPTSPGVFTFSENGLGPAAALHADFSAVNAAHPASPGEIVQVYLTGMGVVEPAVVDGAPAPATLPLAEVTAPVAVTVGGVEAEVSFSGLAPNYAGLYQLNIAVPASLAPGLHSLSIQTVEGFTDMADLPVGP